MKSLSDDPESLCLVKERRELESHFNTFFFFFFTTEILTDPTNMKKSIKKIDKDQRLEKCALKAPLGCDSWWKLAKVRGQRPSLS